RRRRNWFAWTIVVELFSVLGLMVWLLVRRRSQPASQSIGGREVPVIFATVLTLLALDVAVRFFWTSFVFQVARVEGHAMSPTLNDQDRLIVNKVAFRLRDPRAEDIVMLYYPIDPDKVFVK